ncbi:MAG: CRISPR-associated endonuclease Cas1 [Chloroflexi bacterium]|nr:CRISPR-associated endonuclease Cas1 [Chloroflexota bacterium]
MPTLYLLEPDSRLEKEYGRLLVTREDEVLLRVPIQNVSAVVIVGMAGATTQALHALLEQGTPLYLARRSGELKGRLVPATSPNLPLRQKQYEHNTDSAFAFSLAKEIVSAKIENQAVLCKRLARRMKTSEAPKNGETSEVWMPLKRAAASAKACEKMDSLLGIEGSAANAYFSLFQGAFDPEWKFNKRTRRPPKDPVNALLSLGYTFLGYAMMTALEVVGLDPYLGYFHQEEYGRPALALDLIEEFRAPVVDSLVMSLINRRLLEQKDFTKSLEAELRPERSRSHPERSRRTGEAGNNGGVYLTRTGMRVFLREFEDRLETEITLPEIGRPVSYRKLFEVQARKMAHLILGEAEKYEPFRWR